MVSIIICTYNRSDILDKCLRSIVEYGGKELDNLEIIVVDNNSNDATKTVCNNYLKILPLRYYLEMAQGLANARNSGAINSSFEWLFYMDDDSLIQKDTIKQLFFTIENYDFEIFGGIYEAYYLETKPKWLSEEFGTKQVSATKIEYLEKDFLEGGILVIKKSVFKLIGYFRADLGMKADSIGYSEESDFLKRAKQSDVKCGINPFFKIYHIVGRHKFNVYWHLKAYYALGRDKIDDAFEISFARTLILLPFRVVKYFIKYLFEKNFYFENFIWYSFNNTFYLIGRVEKLLK